MKKFVIVLALLALAVPALAAPSAVRISQVYGGGGSSSTTPVPSYNRDYVEIYNASNTAVNIGGWTIEYGSATGSWGSSASNIFTFPVGTIIPPCKYILVGGAWAATYTGANVPYDFAGLLAAGAASGKIGLFNAVNTNLACGLEIAGTLVDKVAYGTSNCAEGTAVGLLSTVTAAIRNRGGYTDTDNNLNDFTVGTPAPRNLLSPINLECGLPVATEAQSWGSLKGSYR